MANVLVIDGHTCGRRTVAQVVQEQLAAAPQIASCRLLSADELTDGHGADVLVYLPRVLPGRIDAPDLAEARRVLALADGRLVLCSSAAVYGNRPENPGYIREAAGRPQHLPADSTAQPWIALEKAAEAAVDADRLAILRPAATPVKDGGDYLSRFFGGSTAVALMGHDPSLQLLDPEDLAQAVLLAVTQKAQGPYNIAPDGVVPLKAALRLTNTRRLAVGLPTGNRELVRYGWTVSNHKAKTELGFAPRHGTYEALCRLAGRDPGTPPVYDDYGMDPDYIAAYGRSAFWFLERLYWRIEMDGFEHIPASGRAVLAGVHRGFMPLDAVLFLHLAVKYTRRYPRFLIHPTLIKFAGQFNFMTKLGGIVACQDNADWVLARDEMVGIYPEGIRGTFQHYWDSHTIGRFGRNNFVKLALRHQAPIIPFVNVGAAEIFPIVARFDWRWWKRFSMWPFFPIAPPFPLLPVPMPSKWHIQVLEPLHIEQQYPPEAADDRRIVNDISQEVRQRMQAAYDDLRRRRATAFFGKVFAKGKAR